MFYYCTRTITLQDVGLDKSRKIMTAKFLSLMIALSFSFTLQARSPAVDPVMGISIEEYEHVDPSTAKGFDFSSGKANQIGERSDNTTTQGPIRRPAITPEQVKTAQSLGAEENAKTPMWVGILLAATCIVMPLAIWGLVFRPQSHAGRPNAEVSNLEEARNQKKAREEQDKNLPKAS